MYCPYCGKSIPDYSTFCISCGKQLQNQKKSLSKIISWESILIGLVALFIGLIVTAVIFIIIYGLDSDKWSSTASVLFVFVMGLVWLVSTGLVGYIGEKNYLSGMLNAFLATFIFCLMAGILTLDIEVFSSVVILGILALMGGAAGVFIKKRFSVSPGEPYDVQ